MEISNIRKCEQWTDVSGDDEGTHTKEGLCLVDWGKTKNTSYNSHIALGEWEKSAAFTDDLPCSNTTL